MRQTHSFYSTRNTVKKANFKKTLQCIKCPPPKNLSYYRGGTYLSSPLLAADCPWPDSRQAPCVNETHIINVTAGLSIPAVSASCRQLAYSADMGSAFRICLTVPGTKPVTLYVSSLHVTICPFICKDQSYVAYNISIFKPQSDLWLSTSLYFTLGETKVKLGKKLRSVLV